MENELILAYMVGFAGLLIAISALIGYLTLKRKVSQFFTRGDVSFEKMMERQLRDLAIQEEKIRSMQNEISQLHGLAQISCRKMAFMRFNPFNSVGSDQSFTWALLDANNDGIVITSHFGRDFNKIYAKPIGKGICEYQLSDEEKKVLNEAIAKK